ncbi:MAG: NUDIX domain-containing protein [Candidatus Paceibacterota bacterium]
MTDVLFVDESDNVIGFGSRKEALAKGIIHRIVRVVLFNEKGQILLQKRAMHLPSNPSKWDLSVAGYVDRGENYLEAALREMNEELGLAGITLTKIGTYYSEEPFKNRTRKRFTTLYRGFYDGEVIPNPDEVSEVQWTFSDELQKRMLEVSDEFTFGSKVAFKHLPATQSSTEF